ncbi:MAG: tRNA uridine-5-carboxymethylaminomethyl(34) synthesis GTPase MnmE [Candidatus Eremiobacteraeota bacterium]|nr:tRNA uridine-5-carboxymethylaminomethyl(34) synthesis GTPase MnmE [Candidatus Eremiobacteraeota bacterium]
MTDSHTIAAIATPPGVSAIAVLRISGPQAHAIGCRCFAPRRAVSRPRAACLHRGWLLDARDATHVDDALAVWFYAPASYTGEDLLELHVHGGTGVASSALASALHSGARLAAPGEFTRRAYLNRRLDLAQAEAVADLINAETGRAARAAVTRLEGSTGNTLRTLRGALFAQLVAIEAHVDYPDEVPAPDLAVIARCIATQRSAIGALLADAAGAKALRDGIDCVIAGPPNAGKSSLLNALLEAERAIVSPLPGTTRDIIEGHVAVEGVVLRLRDTAGLRATPDAIEAEGVERAKKALREAELGLVVIDASKPLSEEDRGVLALSHGKTRLLVGNKLDLGGAGVAELRTHAERAGEQERMVLGSVLTVGVVDEIRQAIAALGWGGRVPDAQNALVANSRQIEALTRATEALDQADETLRRGLPSDLLCPDLRDAAAAYGEVTGEDVSAEIIEQIFARFCVGK